ncbi:MAG: SpoIIIAC/SpoIIIAD family protein [Lachnospiraceae bacterium]|nr:SpoIIIAC/SpoIIIAD family protein [Oscillospiraceae bacterium]MDY5647356.1 SpoIIIAC/SpoIIIAD family protein [Lachnospiraceae bacterium]
MDMIRIGAAGIAGAMLAVQLKHMKSEYAVYVSLAVSIFIFYYALHKLHIITETIETLQKELSIRAVYLKTLLKIAGITYVSEFSSAICKDAGYQAIAGQIEIFGKLTILAVSMPILLALLENMKGFLGI